MSGTDIKAVVNGAVSPFGFAQGTLLVVLVLTIGQTLVEYSTGDVSWTAYASL